MHDINQARLLQRYLNNKKSVSQMPEQRNLSQDWYHYT